MSELEKRLAFQRGFTLAVCSRLAELILESKASLPGAITNEARLLRDSLNKIDSLETEYRKAIGLIP